MDRASPFARNPPGGQAQQVGAEAEPLCRQPPLDLAKDFGDCHPISPALCRQRQPIGGAACRRELLQSSRHRRLQAGQIRHGRELGRRRRGQGLAGEQVQSDIRDLS